MIKLGLAILLVAVIALADQGKPAEPVCSAVIHGQTMTAAGSRWAEAVGKAIHDLAALTDSTVTPESWDDFKHQLRRKVLSIWWKSLFAGVSGARMPPEVIQLRDEQQREKDAAQLECAVRMKALTDCPSDGATPPQGNTDPFDPRSASFQRSSSQTGAEVAAAALRQAGFPESEIAMGVAVAKYETGWRNISGPTVGRGTMRGMWQINDGAHPDLMSMGDWRDPYVNARMAYSVWRAAGGSWSPWSTWRTARAHLQPVPAAGSATPNPVAPRGIGCVGASGALGVNVATWNTYVHNSTGNVVAGMRAIAAAGADVIGTQELPTAERRNAVSAALPGFQIVGMDTSTPIWFRTAKFDLVHAESKLILRRHMPFEGPPQGARFLAVAQVRDKATGQISTYVNTHMLPRVQKGGRLNTSWPRRIAAYRHQLAVVVDTARHFAGSGPVTVLGDFNFNGDPDGVFGRAGLVSSSQVLGSLTTRGGRDIDQVRTLGATPSSQTMLSRYGSDHTAKLVRFVADTPVALSGGAVPADFNRQGNPRTVEQAIAAITSAGPRGFPGERVQGRCERYMNLAYGLSSGYPTAIAHWNAPGPKSTTGVPPRGALVFWRTGNAAGHVALSLGGGVVVSTDYNASSHRYQAGMVSAGPIGDIDKWGPRLGWRAPSFRGVRA